jgi:hypothetical protein
MQKAKVNATFAFCFLSFDFALLGLGELGDEIR